MIRKINDKNNISDCQSKALTISDYN